MIMKTAMFSLLLLISFVLPIAALKTVYVIRHCDKYRSDEENPCCTSTGYDRANTWNQVFDPLLQGKSTYIYSALANYDTLCRPNVYYEADKNCQHSQRLAMTSLYLSYNLNSTTTMKLNYCVGEYQAIIDDIYDDAKDVNRAIIVWQHTEMVDILRAYNIANITNWPTDLEDEYSIIFQLQFASDSDKHPVMYYNCYDYRIHQMQCDVRVHNWLQAYPMFNVTLAYDSMTW